MARPMTPSRSGGIAGLRLRERPASDSDRKPACDHIAVTTVSCRLPFRKARTPSENRSLRGIQFLATRLCLETCKTAVRNHTHRCQRVFQCRIARSRFGATTWPIRIEDFWLTRTVTRKCWRALMRGGMSPWHAKPPMHPPPGCRCRGSRRLHRACPHPFLQAYPFQFLHDDEGMSVVVIDSWIVQMPGGSTGSGAGFAHEAVE